MANDNLKRILELSNKVENTPKQPMPQRQRMISPEDQIKQFDDMVYGKPVVESGGSNYSAEEEMERIKKREMNGDIDVSNSKLPKKILESFIAHPNPVDTSILQDSRMDAFTAKLKDKYGSSAPQSNGLENVKNIQSKLDEADSAKRQPIEEVRTVNAAIDYSLIKTIVESVVTEKMSNFLNESKTASNNSNFKAMIMKNGFFFLDDQDNVYECKMVFKGKNKHKK